MRLAKCLILCALSLSLSPPSLSIYIYLLPPKLRAAMGCWEVRVQEVSALGLPHLSLQLSCGDMLRSQTGQTPRDWWALLAPYPGLSGDSPKPQYTAKVGLGPFSIIWFGVQAGCGRGAKSRGQVGLCPAQEGPNCSCTSTSPWQPPCFSPQPESGPLQPRAWQTDPRQVRVPGPRWKMWRLDPSQFWLGSE